MANDWIEKSYDMGWRLGMVTGLVTGVTATLIIAFTLMGLGILPGWIQR